jgi:alcohol dehydrogenase class IV
MQRIASAVGAQDAAEGIYDLIGTIRAPRALKDIGMPADGLDRAAQIAAQNPYYNPRPIEYAGIRELLQHAYEGRRP